MDRLTSMAVFIKAADLGSFAKAASALDMSSQMVAKHVVFLEDRLGATLLDRTTRRQSLTDIGRAYYDQCKLVLAEAEAADSLQQDRLAVPRGTLRVGAPVTFGNFGLPQFVRRFMERYAQVDIDLNLSDRVVDPIEEGLDVVFRIGPLLDMPLIARPLAPYRLIPCASPQYLAGRRMPMVPTDLLDHECLCYASWSRSLGCLWEFTRGGHAETVTVRGRLRSTDWMSLLHLTLAGQGITLGPEIALEPEIQAGRLMRLMPNYEGPSRPMHILYPSGRRPSAAVKAFVEAAIEAFGEETSNRRRA